VDPDALIGRVFCDAFSRTGEPVVLDRAGRVVFAGAANGSGYRLAPRSQPRPPPCSISTRGAVGDHFRVRRSRALAST
jgi:hypothetical protein